MDLSIDAPRFAHDLQLIGALEMDLTTEIHDLPFNSGQERIGYIIDGLGTINFNQLALCPIILNKRCRLRQINVDALGNSFRFVIFALVKIRSVYVALAIDLRRVEQ